MLTRERYLGRAHVLHCAEELVGVQKSLFCRGIFTDYDRPCRSLMAEYEEQYNMYPYQLKVEVSSTLLLGEVLKKESRLIPCHFIAVAERVLGPSSASNNRLQQPTTTSQPISSLTSHTLSHTTTPSTTTSTMASRLRPFALRHLSKPVTTPFLARRSFQTTRPQLADAVASPKKPIGAFRGSYVSCTYT